jgi:hypothetical protein
MLKLHISLERVVKVGREDVDLLLLVEANIAVHEHQEAALVVGESRLSLQLDELVKCITTERRLESLIGQLYEFH